MLNIYAGMKCMNLYRKEYNDYIDTDVNYYILHDDYVGLFGYMKDSNISGKLTLTTDMTTDSQECSPLKP